MNPIQKAWLKVLSPVVTLVNDKLAKRSGMVGKMARFFAFGPRQFGFHPINKAISLANHALLNSMAKAMHTYSFVKFLLGLIQAFQFRWVYYSSSICLYVTFR